MRVCPVCSTVYEEGGQFCLKDGSPLTERRAGTGRRRRVATTDPGGGAGAPVVSRGPTREPSASFDDAERDETALLIQSEAAMRRRHASESGGLRPFRVTGNPEPEIDEEGELRAMGIGEVLDGRYKLLEVIGRGGMGTVFRAEQILLGREMALKVLPHEQLQDRKLVSRFKREAQAMSRLSSPHTVRVHDCGYTGSLLYLAMELLDGESLATVLAREGALGWPRACDLLLQICESLAEAHACGVVHRDLKPANIMLVQTPRKADFIKVLDFGLAKVSGVSDPYAVESQRDVFGTPHYMSPEQILSGTVDHRADVYSLGAVAFHMLTGQRMYGDLHSSFEVLSAHVSRASESVLVAAPNAGIPDALAQIVGGLLEKKPHRRFQSADAVIGAISFALSEQQEAAVEAAAVETAAAEEVAVAESPTLATEAAPPIVEPIIETHTDVYESGHHPAEDVREPAARTDADESEAGGEVAHAQEPRNEPTDVYPKEQELVSDSDSAPGTVETAPAPESDAEPTDVYEGDARTKVEGSDPLSLPDGAAPMPPRAVSNAAAAEPIVETRAYDDAPAIRAEVERWRARWQAGTGPRRPVVTGSRGVAGEPPPAPEPVQEEPVKTPTEVLPSGRTTGRGPGSSVTTTDPQSGAAAPRSQQPAPPPTPDVPAPEADVEEIVETLVEPVVVEEPEPAPVPPPAPEPTVEPQTTEAIDETPAEEPDIAPERVVGDFDGRANLDAKTSLETPVIAPEGPPRPRLGTMTPGRATAPTQSYADLDRVRDLREHIERQRVAESGSAQTEEELGSTQALPSGLLDPAAQDAAGRPGFEDAPRPAPPEHRGVLSPPAAEPSITAHEPTPLANVAEESTPFMKVAPTPSASFGGGPEVARTFSLEQPNKDGGPLVTPVIVASELLAPDSLDPDEPTAITESPAALLRAVDDEPAAEIAGDIATTVDDDVPAVVSLRSAEPSVESAAPEPAPTSPDDELDVDAVAVSATPLEADADVLQAVEAARNEAALAAAAAAESDAAAAEDEASSEPVAPTDPASEAAEEPDAEPAAAPESEPAAEPTAARAPLAMGAGEASEPPGDRDTLVTAEAIPLAADDTLVTARTIPMAGSQPGKEPVALAMPAAPALDVAAEPESSPDVPAEPEPVAAEELAAPATEEAPVAPTIEEVPAEPAPVEAPAKPAKPAASSWAASAYRASVARTGGREGSARTTGGRRTASGDSPWAVKPKPKKSEKPTLYWSKVVMATKDRFGRDSAEGSDAPSTWNVPRAESAPEAPVEDAGWQPSNEAPEPEVETSPPPPAAPLTWGEKAEPEPVEPGLAGVGEDSPVEAAAPAPQPAPLEVEPDTSAPDAEEAAPSDIDDLLLTALDDLATAEDSDAEQEVPEVAEEVPQEAAEVAEVPAEEAEQARPGVDVEPPDLPGSTAAPAPPDRLLDVASLAPGDIVGGQWRIVRRLGVGNVGALYEAHHAEHEETCALKLLHPRLVVRAGVREWLEDLVATSLLLESPITAGLRDLGEHGGTLWLTNPLLDGTSLAALMAQQGRLRLRVVGRIVTKVLSSLEDAHAVGLGHGDLSLRNLFILNNPAEAHFLRVTDFGMASLLTGEDDDLLQSPCLLAPEQTLGQPVDERTDFYGLGCAIYEMLAGRPPFFVDKGTPAERMSELRRLHLEEEPPPLDSLASEELLPGLVQLIHVLLSPAPGDRPATVQEFRRLLRAAARGESVAVERTAAPQATIRQPPQSTAAYSEQARDAVRAAIAAARGRPRQPMSPARRPSATAATMGWMAPARRSRPVPGRRRSAPANTASRTRSKPA